MAGERNLVSASEGDAIERSDHGLAAGFHPSKLIEHRTRPLQEVCCIDRPGAQRLDLLKVTAGDEDALFARREYDALHLIVCHGLLDGRAELGEGIAAEHVHRAVLVVPAEDRHSVFHSIVDDRHCSRPVR